ncbi:hypothetical protein [Candidatus Palauibacter sp.]|uniref:hypothetical protein n=1 Tax=Candidatus Palauibacter sp. TaxID=3101350 RepID=UPI003B5C7481
MRFIGWDKIIRMLQTDECIFLYRRSGGAYTLHTRKMVYSDNVAATDKYGIQVAMVQRETADPGEYKIEIHVTCAVPWDDIAHKELLAQLSAIFPASETRSASIRIREPVAHFVSYNPTLMAQLPRMRDIIVRVSPEEPEELCAVGFDRDAHSGECEENFVGRDLETVMFPIGKGFIPPGWGIGGTRGGEDDDDDTQDPNEPPSGAYALQCPAATRGSTGRCTVHVPDDVTPATLRYQWSSDKGDTKSGGAEANFWDGTATSTANVTVRVTDASGSEVFSDTQPATVGARQNYRPAELNATPYFRNRSYMNRLSPNSPRDKVAGAYTLPQHAPSPPTAARGSGPWANEYYAQASPYIPTLLHIVSDYNSDTANTDVGRYPGGNSTCPSSSSNVVNQAAYYDVNYYCQTWTAAGRVQTPDHIA